jgi:hypothetical protein
VRRDRLALGLLFLGVLLLYAGVAFPWVGLAAMAAGAAWYAAVRRRESLATFAVLVGCASVLSVLSIWFFVVALPLGAIGLVLSAFARPGWARRVAFALNGLAFTASVALSVLWLAY